VRRGVFALIGALVVAGAAGIAPVSAADAPPATSAPVATDAGATATTTPIKHFVSVMQENHTFDNYFGTYPGADGIPANVCMPVDTKAPSATNCVKPFRIGKRPISDLASGVAPFDAAFAKGAMNGFVAGQSTNGVAVDLPMGHYDDRDIPYYWNLADRYVLFDRFFTSIGGGSVWNHLFWVSGQAGNTAAGESVPPDGYPASIQTIFDELQAKGISWKFYVQNYDPNVSYRSGRDTKRGAQVPRVPLLAMPRFLDNPTLKAHIVGLDEYYNDLEQGTLPAVSYIVPSGNSEHPPGNIQSGQAFVRSIVNSLQRSTAWPSSALLLTYDSWGGWYDHVAPPAEYGFRTPAILVSAYARQGAVDHTQLDFTSILKFIQGNWSLPPLPKQRVVASDFGDAFAFNAAPRPAEFVPSVRHPATTPAPKRGVIYFAYGGAFIFSLVLIAVAARSMRRRTVGAAS
jgi:phospholipase C